MLQQVIIGCRMEGRESKREGGVITKDGEMGEPVLSRRPSNAGTFCSQTLNLHRQIRSFTPASRRDEMTEGGKTYQTSLATTGRVKEMLNCSSGLNGFNSLLYMIQNLGSVSYSLTLLA